MSNGYIYIMINPSLEKDLLKIGRTTRKPEERASELCTTGVPARFHVAYEEEVENCFLAESLLHQQLASYRYDQKRVDKLLPRCQRRTGW
jgi:T5orf172 domain-containing protein